MSSLKELQRRVAAARKTTEDLSSIDRDLRDMHAAVTRERDAIVSRFEPVNIVIANMRAEVDAAAQHFAAEYGMSMLLDFSGRMELQRDGSLTPRRPRLWWSHEELQFRHLCGLVPDLVKTRLEEIIRGVSLTDVGLPLNDRPPAVAAADERIRAIEDEHAALADMAAEMNPPIRLQLLEPVRQRRDSERARQAREAEALAVRRATEEALNQSAVGRGRTAGESSYLRSESRRPV